MSYAIKGAEFGICQDPKRKNFPKDNFVIGSNPNATVKFLQKHADFYLYKVTFKNKNGKELWRWEIHRITHAKGSKDPMAYATILVTDDWKEAYRHMNHLRYTNEPDQMDLDYAEAHPDRMEIKTDSKGKAYLYQRYLDGAFDDKPKGRREVSDTQSRLRALRK